ncbi:MAG: YDG domain-containing protein, partial [Rubrivivax sp.]|nr:YDG domain-containing protein [Rubrivivax sp.]
MPHFQPQRLSCTETTARRARRRPPVRALVRALAVAGVVSHLGLAALPPAAAQALPSGMNVVHGQATAVVNGSRMTVTNSANAVLNWQAFSVGAGQQVRFEQPAAASRVLNRVVGNDASQIFGSISSNGQVWLLNPHGVLFGRDARVDVGALVVSTLGMPLADWISGQGTLSLSSMGAAGAATIVNQGELRAASGGRIWLLGGDGGVRNEGLIAAPDGQVVLAAGRSVDLVDERLPNVAVRVGAPGADVLNLGSVAVGGGRVDLLAAVVNQSGIVSADSVGAVGAGLVRLEASESLALAAGSVTSASGTSGGRVLLDAGPEGTLLAAGAVQATGGTGRGGEVQMLGRHVGLTGDAAVDASGTGGGGQVLVGGGLQGKDSSLRNAEAVYFGPAASVRADAIEIGDGGRIILWSDETTRAYGSLSARGGAAGGDGGFIETSGGWLDARPASVRTDAPAGQAGMWLLDPYDITIVQGVGAATNMSGAPDFESTGSPAVLYAGSIVTALVSTDVTVTTGAGGAEAGNIVMNGVTMFPSLSAARSLTLDAANDIDMVGSVIGSSGTSRLTVNFVAGRDIYLDNATLDAYGGPLTANMTAGRDLTILNSDLFATTGLIVSMTVGRNLSVSFTDVATSAGPLAVELDAGGNVGIDSAYFRADGGSNDFSATAGEDLYVYNTYFDVLGLAGGPMKVSLVAGGNVDIDNGYFGGSDGGPPLSMDIVAGGNFYLGESEIYGNGAPSSATVTAGGSVNFVSSFSWLYLTGDTGVTIAAPAINVSGAGAGVDIDVDGPIQLFTDSYANSGTMNLWSRATGTAILMAGFDGPNVASFTNSGFLDLCACTSGARWLLYLDDGATGVTNLSFDFVQHGASYPAAPAVATGNGLMYSSAAVLTVRNSSPITKVYDATTTVTNADTGLEVTGLHPGHFISDEGAFSDLTLGSYVSANAANDITITVNGFVLPLIETNAYGGPVPVYGYTADNDVRGDITRRELTASGVTAASKVYDGNRDAQLSGGSLGNLVAGQTLTLTLLNGLFDTANVGTGKLVTGTVALANGSGLATNYQLVGGSALSTTADITPRQLTLSGVFAADKVYDGTRDATLSGGSLGNLASGESLGLTLSGGLFDTANAGTAKPVTGTALLTNGSGQLSNYQLVGGGAVSTTANTTPRPLTLSGVQAANKVYDGSRQATLFGGSLGNLVGAETLGLTLTGGLFDTANVGTGKAVTGTAVLANGTGLASNYAFAGNAVNATADITRRPLSLSGVAAVDKVYDGTRVAELSGGSLANLVAGETLGVTVPDGLFDTANVGTSKAVTGTALLVDGSGLASNYELTGGVAISTTGSIDPRPLTLSGVSAADKVYDGNRDAVLSGGSLVNLVAGETLGLTLSGGLFDTANAGVHKPVAGAVALADGTGLASNYVLANGGAAVATATIAPRLLTLGGVTASDKVYDGTRTATLAGGTLGNLVGGETLGLVLAGGLFDTENVGLGKPVTGTVALVDGTGLAANYALAGAGTLATTAAITPRLLALSGAQAADKVYDGTRDAVLSGGSLLNLVAGETLALSYGPGLFDTADAGAGKPVSATAILGDGSGRVSNYLLADGGALVTTASIGQRPVTLSGVVAADKVYDGTRTAALSGGQLENLVTGETLGVVLTGGLFDTADVGLDKAVSGSVALADGSGRASNYVLASAAVAATADVLPALLQYVADPVMVLQGRPIPTLTGQVIGFVGGDTLAGATTGALGFATSATELSLPGSYAIDGFGLVALNYILAQALGNADAMSVVAPPPRESSTELTSIFIALRADPLPLLAPGHGVGTMRTLDALQGLRTDSRWGTAFGTIDVDAYSRDALAVLLEARSAYKRSLFGPAMKRLEADPGLADLPLCVSPDELDTGRCLVSDQLLARAGSEPAAGADAGALTGMTPPLPPPMPTPPPAPVPAPSAAPSAMPAPAPAPAP